MPGVLRINSSLGGMKFGKDGDGNYGYYGADGSLIPFSSYYSGLEAIYKYSFSYTGAAQNCRYNIKKINLKTNEIMVNQTITNYATYSDDAITSVYIPPVYSTTISGDNLSGVMEGKFCISQNKIRVWSFGDQWSGDMIILKGGNFSNDNLINELFGLNI
mgnify:CR=1 FL=1